MRLIYLDSNSTTSLLPAVAEAMLPYLSGPAGNPASAHAAGRRARRALEDSREQVAALLGAHASEVVFTSGATEANNLAIFGLVGLSPGPVIATRIEHPSVLEPLGQLARMGSEVRWLPVDPVGIVPADALVGRASDDARLVCVMLVNHETGAVQPIEALAHSVTAPFHCDATQAAGKMPIDFHALGVTTLSLSAHKFHGPVGIGVLLVREGARVTARTWGGHQQEGRRPGTEPVALAVGLATALAIAVRQQAPRREFVARLRARFLEQLQTRVPPVVVNSPAFGSPYVINLSFPGCRSDALLMNLDLAGIACSTGSACSSGSLLPSPVLQAQGVPDEILHSAMRFSFSAMLDEDEIEEAATRVAGVVARLRDTHLQ